MSDVNEAKERIKKKFVEEAKKTHRKDERIFLAQSLLEESEKSGLDGYTEFFLGYREWLNKNNEKAIEYFNDSIEHDVNLAFPWYGLGNVYRDLKDSEKAIESYQKALAIDKNFSFPWNGLGFVYSELKESEKAIECYKKAIAIDENFSYPWNGLGAIHYNSKEYKKAIACYDKAVKIDEKFALPWYNLGITYTTLKNYKKAESTFKRALELSEFEKNNFWISATKEKLKAVEQRLQSQEILKEIREENLPDAITKVLNATIKAGIEEKALENKKSFLSFIDENKPGKDENKDYFQVLRRWNSYTPIIADSYHISKGGGYFFKVGGKGIVIDPGFNFIENFKGKDHLFNEIDTVLVSHAHNDHTADLESILTLLYKYNKEIKDSSDPGKENTIRKEIARERKCDIRDVSSDEIEEEFLKSPRRKIIDFYLTNSVFKKFSGLFDLSSKENYKIHTIEEGDVKKLNHAISFEVICAKHQDIISDMDSVGFAIEVGNSVLIYTGDTGWSDKIEENYKKIVEKYKNKDILLVAHLGGFKETEINYINKDTDREKAFYSNHLGRLGLVKINEVVRPRICFISEFGEEFKKFRTQIARIYQDAFDGKILFFPADIGLTFNLESKTINAVIDVNLDEYQKKIDEVEPGEIETCLLRKDNSLHYFKKDGGFTEGDLIQVLIKEYDKTNR